MTGWANSSFGVNSLYSTVGGGYNNAFGYTALYSNVGGRTMQPSAPQPSML